MHINEHRNKTAPCIGLLLDLCLWASITLELHVSLRYELTSPTQQLVALVGQLDLVLYRVISGFFFLRLFWILVISHSSCFGLDHFGSFDIRAILRSSLL